MCSKRNTHGALLLRAWLFMYILQLQNVTFCIVLYCITCVTCQFFGWMVGANTMLEYLLAGSTVAKGFASYFTTMIGEALRQCAQSLPRQICV